MTKANECTCPSGDGSLRHPCPAHPAVEQAGGDERDLQGAQGERDGWGPLPIVQVPWNVFDRAVMWVEDRRRYGDDGTIVDDWKALKTIQRAALAQPSPAPTMRAAIDVANDRFEVPVAKWGTDLAGEEERPEVVAWRYGFSGGIVSDKACLDEWKSGGEYQSLMTVAQHERITAQLHDALDESDGDRWKLRSERDAALARVAELDKQCRDDVARALGLRPSQERGFAWSYLLASIKSCVKASEDAAQAQHSVPEGLAEFSQFLSAVMDAAGLVRYGRRSKELSEYLGAQCMKYRLSAPVAQAQHSLPEGWMLVECGIWTQEQVDEMQKTVTRFRNSEFVDDRALAMAVADAGQCKAPEISLAELLAAAPGKEVPQAWLDVQAERRRQVEVEGYHGFRDNNYISYELSKAARAYIEVSWHALSGGLPCKKPESWPWMAGFKWSDGRTMLVKACALALAEIERLDRAAHGKEGV